jgi:hypothetical protein
VIDLDEDITMMTYNSEMPSPRTALHQPSKEQSKRPIVVSQEAIGLDSQLVNHALDGLNMDSLMQKIHHLVKMFGGIKYAFDLEWKIRLFTMEVLDHALI